MMAGTNSFYEAVTEYDDKWEFDVVAAKVRERALTGALLDIGCGDGRFLAKLAPQLAVTGLDINTKAVVRARARGLNESYGLTLHDFMARYPNRRYDVVTAFHILEHVDDPSSLLNGVKCVLKPDGIFVVSVPNVDRWTLQWLRESWDYPPHHLTRWRPDTLCRVLERHGFAVREVLPETMVTLRQFRKAARDILWTLAVDRFSLGIATWLDETSLSATMQARNEPSLGSQAIRCRLRNALVKTKALVVEALSSVLALSAYPMLVGRGCKGTSLLVLASPQSASPTD